MNRAGFVLVKSPTGLGLTSGRGTTRVEDAQGTPTQSHVSSSILVNEDEWRSWEHRWAWPSFRRWRSRFRLSLASEASPVIAPCLLMHPSTRLIPRTLVYVVRVGHDRKYAHARRMVNVMGASLGEAIVRTGSWMGPPQGKRAPMAFIAMLLCPAHSTGWMHRLFAGA